MLYLFCRARKMAALFLLLPLVFSAAGARGGSFFFQYTNVYAGTRPEGPSAWVNSLFSDVSTGTVQLKISANGLANGEFLSAMFFNLDPNLNPTKLAFTYVSGSGGFALPTIKTGANSFKADGQGKYDIDFTFSQKATKEFTGNDFVVYDISSSAFTLTASDFNVLSTAAGGCYEFLSAAEISGIPGACDTTGTGWVAPGGVTPAPEPQPLALVMLGGVLCGAAAWRRIRVGRV
jgi:hypothetical protein